MSLLKPFLTISLFTSLSRVLGFVRDILFAAVMGTGAVTEAFLVAFKLPNFFRRLFAEGAFNAAFVPLFSGYVASDGKEQARQFASQVLAVLVAALLFFTLIVEITMPWVMLVLAPGFVGDSFRFDLAVNLTRITFPYLLFISLVSLLGGMLNGIGRFAAVAAAPVLLNLCLIPVLIFHESLPLSSAYSLAIAVSVSGVLQFMWLWAACARAGMRPLLTRPRLTPQVRVLLRRMVPGVIGAGVTQINLWVDVMIATLIPGAVAYLYYADRVSQLPLAIVGTAIGTALLPALSKQLKAQQHKDALYTANRALELGLFLTLPAAAGLMIIALPITATLFEHGAFTREASIATAYAMMAYGAGLPAFVMIKIFAPVFFASGNTSTPVRVAMCAMVTNVVLNITFVYWFPQMGWMPHTGIALATSIAAWLNALLLVMLLSKSNLFRADTFFIRRVLKMLICTGAMALVLLFMEGRVESAFVGGVHDKYHVLSLSYFMTAAIITYFYLSVKVKVYSSEQLKHMFKR